MHALKHKNSIWFCQFLFINTKRQVFSVVEYSVYVKATSLLLLWEVLTSGCIVAYGKWFSFVSQINRRFMDDSLTHITTTEHSYSKKQKTSTSILNETKGKENLKHNTTV